MMRNEWIEGIIWRCNLCLAEGLGVGHEEGEIRNDFQVLSLSNLWLVIYTEMGKEEFSQKVEFSFGYIKFNMKLNVNQPRREIQKLAREGFHIQPKQNKIT